MKKLAFGIDIGGINTAFGLVDLEGNIAAESKISTKAYPKFSDYPKYVEALGVAMQSLLKEVKDEVELVGIGIGAPNANYYCGIIDRPVNLWKYTGEEESQDELNRVFDLVKDLGEYFPNVPIYITNDANAATIGEMVYGAAKGMKDFFMITLGTGVGSGFVSNGEMIYGHDGFAGEFGHVTVERNGRMCGCGKKGCLEAYASAIGIKRTAFELMASMPDASPLRDISYNELDSAMLSEAADKGDPIALEAFRLTGQRLGYAIADAAVITSPEAVFIFGGLAKAGEKLFKHIRYYMEEAILVTYKNKIKILPSGLQDKNVAILGGAALVWQKI